MKTNKAQERASVIMKVQRGEITATEGARQLGLSRKSYYGWEKRGLMGLLEGLQEEQPGRPSHPVDLEKEALKDRVAQLEKELEAAKEVEAVRLVLQDIAKIQERKEKSKKNSKRSNAS
jgi:hypothetical protein